MPTITFGAIIAILKGFGQPVLDRRNDPEKWSVDIEPGDGTARRKGAIVMVSCEAVGLQLVVEDRGAQIALSALPASLGKTKVLVNGDADPDAAMVFALKPSPANPTRFAFDFKRVTLDEEDYRFNFRYDP